MELLDDDEEDVEAADDDDDDDDDDAVALGGVVGLTRKGRRTVVAAKREAEAFEREFAVKKACCEIENMLVTVVMLS